MGEDRQRIVKWLFFARIVKSRTLAAKLVQSGRVRINGNKIDQASRQVAIGDVLTVTLDRQVKVLRIVGAGERRGPYEEARLLYEDMSPPPLRQAGGKLNPLPPLREAGSSINGDRQAIDSQRWHGGCDKLAQAVAASPCGEGITPTDGKFWNGIFRPIGGLGGTVPGKLNAALAKSKQSRYLTGRECVERRTGALHDLHRR